MAHTILLLLLLAVSPKHRCQAIRRLVLGWNEHFEGGPFSLLDLLVSTLNSDFAQSSAPAFLSSKGCRGAVKQNLQICVTACQFRIPLFIERV